MIARDIDLTYSFDLPVRADVSAILEAIECYENNPNYEVYKGNLLSLIEDLITMIHPKGYVVITEGSEFLEKYEKGVIYCLVTLGDWIDRKIKMCFDTYEYLEGMMLNAYADYVLFEASNAFYDKVLNVVNGEPMQDTKLFLTSRFEPGNSQIALEAQREIYDRMKNNFELSLDLTTGFMFSPSKTLAYYYGIVEEDCDNGIDHDCSLCSSETCKSRKYKIHVRNGAESKVIQGRKGQNLLEVLRHNHIFVNAPCSGKGVCGKCKVRVPDHRFLLSPEEVHFLSEREIEQGIVLACDHELDRELVVITEDKEEGHLIEDTYAPIQIEQQVAVDIQCYGIVVDIGTTTLALSLVDRMDGRVIAIEKQLNPQRGFGADVISRIMYVNEAKNTKLMDLIRESILEGIFALVEQGEISLELVDRVVLSGNTTMIYLLLDIDPQNLAVSPFTTVDMGLTEYRGDQIWPGLLSHATVTILPWISAYVGGDIVSGMYATSLLHQTGNCLFIDIGTNGEMVLRTDKHLFCASTAAGPAFEGANIRCGMGSVNGAVCEIHDQGDDFDLKVLGDTEPKGLCGSAIIDAVSLLLQKGVIEDTGYLEAPFMFCDNIGIYPEDVRQVQLAKAAVAAGVSVLLLKAGLKPEDVDCVYLAGGFGSHLNLDHGIAIGIIHAVFKDRVVIVGNSSLAGGVKFLLEQNGKDAIQEIIDKSEYIELSMSTEFNDYYIEHMMFGGDL